MYLNRDEPAPVVPVHAGRDHEQPVRVGTRDAVREVDDDAGDALCGRVSVLAAAVVERMPPV